MARKSKNLTTGTGRMNKSAWIRSQPAALTARDVVDKAKGEGIALSLAQVYMARSTAKRAGSTRVASPPPPHERSLKRGKGDLRHQFVVLAMRLGTDEAQRVLDKLVRGVHV